MLTEPLDRARLESDEAYRTALVERVAAAVGPGADYTDIIRHIRKTFAGSDSIAAASLATKVQGALIPAPPPTGPEPLPPPDSNGGPPEYQGGDITLYCLAILRHDLDAAAAEVLGHLKERGGWNGKSDQRFYTGPWRRAKMQVKKELGIARKPATPKAATPAAPPPPADPDGVDDYIVYRSRRGNFRAAPKPGGRWLVLLEVEVDRSTALNLQGQAFALLYPGRENG